MCILCVIYRGHCQVGLNSKNGWYVIHKNHPNVDDLSIMWYIIQIWMINVCCYLYRTEKSSKFGCFVQSTFGWFWAFLQIIQRWLFCTIHFWMKVNVFLSHPKLDVLYNPLLDDSEHACKSSKGGGFIWSTFGWLCIFRNWMFCMIQF